MNINLILSKHVNLCSNGVSLPESPGNDARLNPNCLDRNAN